MYLRVAGTNTLQGPFQVSSAEAGKYTLCGTNKELVNGGRTVEEKDLQLYDPFASSS